MFRYFAIVWDSEKPELTDHAQLLARRLQGTSSEWWCCLNQNGLRVYVAGERPESTEARLLSADAGVVLGCLFERDFAEGSLPKKALLDRYRSAAILKSQGRSLVENYWGRYVAFLCEATTGSKWIVRDPTGGLPCLTTSFRGMQLYFSCMEDCDRLGLLEFTVDWQYIAARVINSFVQSSRTGLNEVGEVSAGECIEYHGDRRSASFYWHPFHFANAESVEDPARAARELRHATKSCVHAWASCYETILHKLSGGLDSSIVLGCLQDAPTEPDVTCVNYYSRGADGDERTFARAAAEHAGCKLIELERDATTRLDGMLGIAKSAIPTFYLGCTRGSDSEYGLAHELHASALFGGGGGDQLFYQHRADLAAADYVYLHGLRPRIFGIALNAAYLIDASVWAVLSTALKYGCLGANWTPFSATRANRKLVDDAAFGRLGQDQQFLHPWFQTRKRVPPGKYWHAYSLSFPQQFYDSMPQPHDPDRVAPLISQPLVELLLRIPTYVLTTGGRDRAIARRAFAPDVPHQILTRRTKGGMEENAKEILSRNIEFVREFLVDGLLVSHGLLDRRKLGEVLSSTPTTVQGGMAEIFDHLSVEAWLSTWSPTRQRAAA